MTTEATPTAGDSRQSLARTSAREAVQVIGAGPAGLAAAIHLRSHGIPVRVRERRAGVGMRHSGFQGLENWSHAEDAKDVLARLGIRGDFLLRPVDEIHYFGPTRKEHTLSSKRPIFYLVRRGPHHSALDARLAEQAQEAGAVITYDDPVSSAPPGTVVATGPTAAHAIAVGVVFRTDLKDTAACILDPDVAPGAYAYLLTHEGEGTLATMLAAEFHNSNLYLRRAIEAFKSVYGMSMRAEQGFGGAGNMDLSPDVVRGGHLRVGECAGAQDPLWGFGLWFAMTTGHLAADCAATGTDYAREYKKRVLPRMRRLVVARWLFDKLPPARYESLLDRLEREPDVRAAMRRYYTGSRWLSLLYPVVSRRYSFDLREKRCHSQACDCVWCRHGRDDATLVRSVGESPQTHQQGD